MNIKKSVFVMMIFTLLSLNLVFAEPEEFEFRLEVDHDFDDDDDRISCEIVFDDDDSKTFKFDDNDRGDDLVYERDFLEKVEVDCDEKVDEINIKVIDSAGVELFDEDYKHDKSVDYDLETYDEDEEWFEIKLKHDFGSKDIDCKLEVDSNDYDYTFDKDDSSDTLKIRKNFDKLIKFSCDDEIDEIQLKVYDDDNDEVYDKDYEEDDKISYDADKSDEDLTEAVIEIEHDFDEDVKCEIEIDDDETKKYEFTEDSSSSDLKIALDFLEFFKFECDERLDEITVRIYDDDGNKIDTLEEEREDEFTYELSGGEYDYVLNIINDFESDEDIKCEFITDSKVTTKLKLDRHSRISDLRNDGNFDGNFVLDCDGNLDKVEFSTYYDGKSTPLFEQIYNDVKTFTHKQKTKAEMDKIAADKKIAEDAEKLRLEEAALAKKKEEEALAKKKIEDERRAAEEKAKLEAQKLNISNGINSGDVLGNNNLSGNVIKDGVDSSDSSKLVYLFIGGIVLICIFAVFKLNNAPKKSVKSFEKHSGFSDVKHNPKSTQKTSSEMRKSKKQIDFSFLDNRK